jgi:DCN1-like protein 1/2
VCGAELGSPARSQLSDSVADASSGTIQEAGLEKLCVDLGIDMFSSPAVLMIGYYMQAPELTDIALESFTRGMAAIGVSTLEELKTALPEACKRIQDSPPSYSAFFKYAFKVNCAEGMRVLDGEVAAALLRALLGPSWPLAAKVADFIEATGIKTVTKDTWVQILAFSKAFPDSLADYDADAAWPVMLDDFVASLSSASSSSASSG